MQAMEKQTAQLLQAVNANKVVPSHDEASQTDEHTTTFNASSSQTTHILDSKSTEDNEEAKVHQTEVTIP